MGDKEFTITDILEMLYKWWGLIVAGMIVVGALMFYYSDFCVTPIYSSSSKMFVQTKNVDDVSDNVLESQRSFAFGQMVVNDYMDIFRTYTFAEELSFYLGGNTHASDSASKCIKLEAVGIDELTRQYSGAELFGMISYSSKEDSALFSIKVQCQSQTDAQKIAECMEIIMPDYLDDKTSGIALLEVVDKARPSNGAVNDNTTRNTVLGIFVGAVLAFVIAFVIEINDTRVRDEKSLTEIFQIPVIGAIPECNSAGNTNSEKS